MKRITRQQILGEQGIALIKQRVLAMGHVFHQTGALEAGIDGFIEIRRRDTGEVTNFILQVQSKATDSAFQSESPSSLEFLCAERDVEYWMQGNAPVILIVSRPNTDEAYWVSIKDSFRDLARRKARKIAFDKQRDRFDSSCYDRLAEVAIPRERGIYLAPPPRHERIYTNLLQVGFAPKLYLAATEFTESKAIVHRLREAGLGRGRFEFVLNARTILSFHDLSQAPWNQVCDPGSVESFASSQWADSDDQDQQRQFVWLLNECLHERARQLDLNHSRDCACFYFKATGDLSPRRISYQSLKQGSKRTVFKSYPKKSEPGKIAYCRHGAFQGQFRRYGGHWYLEIRPTYYFTFDGYRLHKFYEDQLKGIKRQERNPSVLQQVVMWADYLRGRSNELPLIPRYSFVQFEDLVTFDVDFGVPDEAWLPREEDDETVADKSALDDLTLFRHTT